MFDLKINVGHCDLHSMVQWFCLISWRLFDVWTLLFGIMSQYDPKFDLKINIGHYDLYFMVQWFCVTSWRLFDVHHTLGLCVSMTQRLTSVQWFCLISWRLFDVCTSYFGSKNQYDPMFDLKINIGHFDLYFIVHWFCLISWSLFDVCTSYFGSMNQYDPTLHLRVNVGHCDLYSMVQWFCLISWRLFDVWTLWFEIMSQYDPKFDLKINIGHYDLYFMVQWFALHLEDCLMYEHHTLGLLSVWPDVWPQNKCRSICISWSSDFVLYLQDYLIHVCHIFI